MTRFWWVRHGPTHEKAFVGWRDVPADLSDQARIARLSAHLPQEALLVSSDLQRAAATGDAIVGNRRRLPHDPSLREFNLGDWDGMPFDEVAARDPDLSRAFWDRPGDIAPPGGESWNDLARRVNTSVAELCQLHRGQDIVVVAHIGVILTQIQAATGQSASDVLSHRIDNLSVTLLSHDDAGWTPGPINHCP